MKNKLGFYKEYFEPNQTKKCTTACPAKGS
jgi:hypothetical protein